MGDNICLSTFIRMIQAQEKEYGECKVVSIGTTSRKTWVVIVDTDEGEKYLDIPMYKRMY